MTRQQGEPPPANLLNFQFCSTMPTVEQCQPVLFLFCDFIRQDIMVPQNRPTKLDFWYFFTFVCCNACSVGDFTKISNFVNHFCVSRSYKNRPHFCSTKLAYKKTGLTAVLQFFGIIFWMVQPHRLTVDGSHVKKRPPKDGTQFFESKF